MGDPNEALVEAKRVLRGDLRRLRRALPDRAERSQRVVGHLIALEAIVDARRLMAYDAVVGEVDLSDLVSWARVRDIEVRMPEDDVVPEWPDVIVVPGVGFTARGERLGQGGGWYDRFLPLRRADCVLIGVGFAEQVLDALPVAEHDVRLDRVVTDDGPIRSQG